MYTEPKIVSSNDLTQRAYVKVYINGERHRFYNGKLLGINCNPNRCVSIKERNRALTTLSFTLRKKLETGWIPSDHSFRVQPTKATDCILQTMTHMKKEQLSTLYLRDVQKVGEEFIQFLNRSNKQILIDRVGVNMIEEFLKPYSHSNRYYMNKRRTLGGIFKRISSEKNIDNPVSKTARLKERSTLHEVYSRDQLLSVLELLKEYNHELYKCALLMYGCLLRPHQEIRLLCRKHFNEDVSVLALSGNENKTGNIRSVYIPDYVRTTLIEDGLLKLKPVTNIFSRTVTAFNVSYFNTSWSRLKVKMIKDGLIGDKHTLYSFRHTAAVNLYNKTKDLYKVQQAMGHSDMTVTLIYLRGLGLVLHSSKDDVPDLLLY